MKARNENIKMWKQVTASLQLLFFHIQIISNVKLLNRLDLNTSYLQPIGSP